MKTFDLINFLNFGNLNQIILINKIEIKIK